MSIDAELDVLLRSSTFVPTLGVASVVLVALSLVVLYLRHRKSSEQSAVATGKVLQQNGVADGSEPSGPKVTLLYGTQTGTAERFAKQLKNEMTSRYGDTNHYSIVDIEEYKAEEVLCNEKLVFFLMATYGDGEPTDNAADFYNWLIKAGKEAEDEEGQTLLKVLTHTGQTLQLPCRLTHAIMYIPCHDSQPCKVCILSLPKQHMLPEL